MSFEGFYEDMGDPPHGLTIERRNVNGNYNKQNCSWADRTEQARNRRNSSFINIEGVRLHAKDAAEFLGIQYKTLMARRSQYGWSDEDIVNGSRRTDVKGPT